MSISTFVRADRLAMANAFVSTEETRYYLTGVFIEPVANVDPVCGGMRIVSTDGHRLAVFRDDEGFSVEPRIVRMPKALLAAIKKATRRSDQVYLALMGDKRGATRYEARLFDALGFENLSAAREAVEDVTHENQLWLGVVDVVDGTFPDWRRVLPKTTGKVSEPVGYQTKYLADFQAISAAGGGRLLTLYATDKASPVLVDCGRDDFVGIIMPMKPSNQFVRETTEGFAPPAWASVPAIGDAKPE